MTSKFIGRGHELTLLERGYGSGVSDFVVIYGRRRVGKTTLLRQFIADKPAFYFCASKEPKRRLLRRFVQELGNLTRDPLIARTPVSEWYEALTLLHRSLDYIRRGRPGEKVIIVFDEFQWACRRASELTSELQRWWDQRWQTMGNVQLILCGSYSHSMKEHVLSSDSPLFGRRTRSFELCPLSFPEASEFLPDVDWRQQMVTYLTFGGIPHYLQMVATAASFDEFMTEEAFTVGGYFLDETTYVLSEQLKESKNFHRVLALLAEQPMSPRRLELATGIANAQLIYYLDRLQSLGFVQRTIPYAASPDSTRVRYRLLDAFLSFYFCFIEPNRQRIRQINPVNNFATITGEHWEAFLNIRFHQFLRDHAAFLPARVGCGVIQQVSCFWQKQTKRKQPVDIDLLLECDDDSIWAVAAQWGSETAASRIIADLQRNIQLLPEAWKSRVRPLLVTAGANDTGTADSDDVRVVSVRELFAIHHG